MIRHKKADGSRVVTYFYKFSDGYENHLTRKQAMTYKDYHSTEYALNGYKKHLEERQVTSGCGVKKDAFKPGFHPGLGMHVETRQEYRELLKEKGLEEVGGDENFKPNVRAKMTENSVFTEEACKDLISKGAEIPDNEMDHLRDQELNEDFGDVGDDGQSGADLSELE